MFDPYVTAQFLRSCRATLNGEAVLKGRSLFANRVGEEVASPLVTLVDDATNPLAYTATDVDGEGLATRRTPAHRRRRAAGLRAVVLQRPAQRHGLDRQRGARRFKRTPACGALALQLAPGHAARRPS